MEKVIGNSLDKAEAYLRAGEVVAIPTETVYGLAGNAYDEEAVKKIYAIKQRPYADPLIVHASSVARVEEFVAYWPPLAKALASACWPGPLTLLLPKKPIISDWVTAGLPRVGVRVPAHPVAQELLARLSFPLAAPSANPFGYISPTKATHVAQQLGDMLPYILDGGDCQMGLESTIVGFDEDDKPILYRLGSIPVEIISDIVGSLSYYKRKVSTTEEIVHAPGTLLRHYAPNTTLVVGAIGELLPQYHGKKVAALRFCQAVDGVPQAQQVVLSSEGNLLEAAQRLFAALRYLDNLGCDVVLAEPFPDYALGKTINDRLMRASK